MWHGNVITCPEIWSGLACNVSMATEGTGCWWSGPVEANPGRWIRTRTGRLDMVHGTGLICSWCGSPEAPGFWWGFSLGMRSVLVLDRPAALPLSLTAAGRRRTETNLSAPVHPLCNHAAHTHIDPKCFSSWCDIYLLIKTARLWLASLFILK